MGLWIFSSVTSTTCSRVLLYLNWFLFRSNFQRTVVNLHKYVALFVSSISFPYICNFLKLTCFVIIFVLLLFIVTLTLYRVVQVPWSFCPVLRVSWRRESRHPRSDNLSPAFIFIPPVSHASLLKIYSNTQLNDNGESGSPCLTSLLILKCCPMSITILASNPL